MIAFSTDFIQQTTELLGSDANALLEALQETPSTSIRLNKSKKSQLKYDLSEPIPWCKEGYYLNDRPTFTLDPFLHAGGYYVQEASSMFLAHILSKLGYKEPILALDLCAAPGGKTTLISDFIPRNSLTVANEVIRSRAGILAENVAKWGNPNVVITSNDPKDFSALPHMFDLVVVDAPCSGEGMFRKDESARGEWSLANVRLCAERQRRILADIWNSLRPGGFLVYSTCTFNAQENEENVKWLMNEFNALSIPVNIKEFNGVTPSSDLFYDKELYGYRFFPHRVRGEGLFMALLQKPDEPFSSPKMVKEKGGKGRSSAPTDVKQWLIDPDSYEFWVDGNEVVSAIHARYVSQVSRMKQVLKVVRAGVEIARVKGKNVIPSVNLALSTVLNRASFAEKELDLGDALRYLKKETFALEGEGKGYQLMCYKGMSLGFIKNIGNRFNNLYPAEWHIRMSIDDVL
ncbi:MAG: rRNA cytosine-C5-methyltransferase [Prevotellaceae bacterium]|jgi:16S rRNA C967 or C1407 C5-methylase (RsmB/RsmF family)/NOL1/NOP2/fmu family ribosome biogenesis protein|nr:rRNA cytosine-C5-methyltransferase [Prevotellaceae bacterium]